VGSYPWTVARADAAYGDPVADRLLALVCPRYGGVRAYRPFLRAYLPTTDFAYAWKGCPEVHWWALCANRRARDAMIAAKLLTEEEFVGMAVVDEPYPGAQVLDTLPGGPAGPGPPYSQQALAEIREELQRCWAAFSAKPKPVRKPSLSRSLAFWRARQQREPGSFQRPATRKALDEANRALPAPLPGAWAKVLQAANGACIENCPLCEGYEYRIWSTDAIPEEHAGYLREVAAALEDQPEEREAYSRYLHVASSAFGDYLCLDVSTVTETGDCRVVQISHETWTIEREWDNVATFLEDLLEEPGR
jgi:hypothetical protein